MKFRPPCFPWYLHCIRQLESKCLGLALPHLLAKKYEISVIFPLETPTQSPFISENGRRGGGECGRGVLVEASECSCAH